MDDEQKIWEQALIKIGLWKRGERCSCITFKGTVARGVYYCVKCRWMFNGVPSDSVSRAHDIPAPPLNNAATAFAMLEWLLNEDYQITLNRDLEEPYHIWWKLGFADGRPATMLPLAVARAVLATQEAA